jgi:hypothetical protein
MDQLRELVQHNREMFDELQTAAYREDCHWDLRIQDLEGFGSLLIILDDVQQTRQMSRILALRARLEIADGKFDDALETLRVGYKLAHDIAEPRILVNDLVAISIASNLNNVLAELTAARGAPNLYWAIAGMPQPFVDMRPALELERAMPLRMFPFLNDAETVERSPEEWRRLAANVFAAVERFEGRRTEIEFRIAALILTGYPRAKRDLIAWGFDPTKVEAMAVCQVMAIHESRMLRQISDEMFKWSLLPPHESLPRLENSMQRLRRDGFLGGGEDSRELLPIAGSLLPALESAMFGSARVERELAALRTIEALRMHAAQAGQLPESLADVKLVPIPSDPVTGKSFDYRLEDGTAILSAPWVEQGKFRGMRYEITLESAR